MSEFTVGETDFLLDGRPVRLLSGALHYFRVHEAQWGHRLAMLRAMGLNCVETYVPWNLHEPHPGEFRDVEALGRFLDAAREAGLWAIVRPGPYICAEWENGGLPHWLKGHARTNDEVYLGQVERWFRRLLPQVVERQIDRGGPVIMVQAENEYGSYGSDAAYLLRLTELLRAQGVTVPLFTSDGPEDHMLTGGSIPGVLATVNFGSDARTAFETLRRYRPDGPLMCMEFWCGWFEHWGGEHVVRDAGDAAAALREILECGASVNLYMAHGGTNFAGWAGANRGGARCTTVRWSRTSRRTTTTRRSTSTAGRRRSSGASVRCWRSTVRWPTCRPRRTCWRRAVTCSCPNGPPCPPYWRSAADLPTRAPSRRPSRSWTSTVGSCGTR